MASQERSTIYRVLRTIKPMRAAVRAVRRVLERHYVSTWRLEGKERVSGHPLTIFFAGQLENKNYIADLVFDGSHTEATCRKMWLWNVFKLSKEHRGDYALVIIDIQVSWYRLFKSPDAFLIPCWIRGELDLAVAAKQSKKSENVNNDLRKIRQHDYRFEVTKDEREFDRFYHGMYLPYAQRVYAGMTYVLSYEDLKKVIGQCELLLVKQDGDDVAGQVLLYEGSRPRAWLLGVKDGDPAYVKSGALAAAYYFDIQHLIERGYRNLHLGGSRPFLRDGVLQYKKKWGMQIVDPDARYFVLVVSRHTTAVKSFLANNPFFFEIDGALSGAIFVAKDIAIPDDAVRRWHKDFVDLGIPHVQVFDLAEGHEPQSGLKIVSRMRQHAPGAAHSP